MTTVKFYLTKLRYRPNIWLSLIFLVVFSFLVIAPLLQIIRTSLTFQSNDLRVVRDATVGDFTLYHYYRVFASKLSKALFYKPFINSLVVGFGVTLMAMTLGTLLAWFIVRTDVAFKPFFSVMMVIPYMMPSWVIALAS